MSGSVNLTETDCRAELALYAHAVSGGRWKLHRHSVYIAEKVQACLEKPGGRLILCVPPQHGKTETAVVYGIPWYLKNHPTADIIFVTYGADLAHKKSQEARQAFSETGYGIGLDQNSQSVGLWRTDGLTGGVVSTGIGGAITGSGANAMFIDDPIKNQEDAESELARDRVWSFWQGTLRTRLRSGASVVVIQTRWHEDDFAGRLMKYGEGWELVNLPAIAEEEDPLGRSVGEPLCPSMYSISDLAATKKDVGSYTWAAQYQQRPSPQGGGYFKSEWFRYFEAHDQFYFLGPERTPVRHSDLTIVFQTVDPAGTKNKASDLFAVVTFGLTKVNDVLILDAYGEKLETTRHEGVLRQQEQKWNPKFQGVESKTFGLNIIQQAKAQGRPVKPLIADVSKVIRSEPARIHYENGQVYHMRNAPWLASVEGQLLGFPKATHDDFVDCISYGVQYARDMRKFVARAYGPNGEIL